MHKRVAGLILLITLSLFSVAYGQQDIQFHLIKQFFPGKNIIKVKRDYKDPYLWALSQNNEVYRINSLTQTVDDYTSYFAAYRNLRFVDIAGCSQDTVFVGTNSPTLLELRKGLLKVIGAADGITGNIKQIGIDNNQVYEFENNAAYFTHTLDIATTSNIFIYEIEKEKLDLPDENPTGPVNLFEFTYRNKIFNYQTVLGYTDPNSTAKTLKLSIQFPVTLFDGYLWYNSPAYGYNINTAYCIKSFYPDNFNPPGYGAYYEEGFLNQVYGTEQGIFINNWGQSYDLRIPYNHYLDGLKVNKITSIYGLTSFAQLLKENLLIGTDKGFYYSNSGYQKYINYSLSTYSSFTLDDDIGNKVINDICVDATSYLPTICEDAVWVAAADGLYFIKPDYAPFLNSAQVNDIGFVNQPGALSVLNICSGSTAAAFVNINNYGGNSIQWYKDGNALTGQSTDTLNITSAGKYQALLYDPCSGTHVESNILQVNVIAGPQFTFDYPDKLQYCDSTSTTLKTTYSPSYHYRWYQDEVLNGDTSSSLNVTKSGKYKVEVSACTNSWVPSKEIEVDLIDLPVPAISADKNIYCFGDNATLNLNVPADPSYTINWYKDGNIIAADKGLTSITATVSGAYTASFTSNIANCNKLSAAYQLAFVSAPTFTFNYPAELSYCANTSVTLSVNGNPGYQYRWYRNDTLLNYATTATSISVNQAGKYKVEVSACQNSWIPSKEVQVDFIQIPLPVITADKPAYCTGDNATLTLSTSPDPYYTISWYKDNVLQPAYTNQSVINTNTPGNYTVTLTSNTTNSSGNICSQTSNSIPVSFNTPPVVSIEQIPYSTFCQGVAISLKADYTSGALKWSTGETTDRIDVTQSGTYTVTLTSATGCTATASTDVNFFPDPVLSVNDTTICTYKHQTVTLTAPAGYAKYYWNAVPGGQTYDVTYPQTVKLTVGDANDCETSQQIHITEQCPDVFIPNTFTPNGDGINDVWDIQGLDGTALVKIFSRYGAMLYQSKGYAMPWDGTYQNKKLPAGTYYYIITAQNRTKTFSGSVTILY